MQDLGTYCHCGRSEGQDRDRCRTWEHTENKNRSRERDESPTRKLSYVAREQGSVCIEIHIASATERQT